MYTKALLKLIRPQYYLAPCTQHLSFLSTAALGDATTTERTMTMMPTTIAMLLHTATPYYC